MSIEAFSCAHPLDYLLCTPRVISRAPAPLPPLRCYDYALRMNDRLPQTNAMSDLLTEWRAVHPELTDEQFAEALTELKRYLDVAWNVYRQQHPALDLPETL